MPKHPNKSGTEGQGGLDFASVLHDCLSSAVIAVDGQERITGFNLQAEKLTGQSSTRVIGQSLDLLAAPIRDILRQTISEGKAVADRELLLRDTPRGSDTSLLAQTVPLADAGKKSGALVILHDVSAARKWESHLRRLEGLHSVGTLSAGLAHEARNAFVAVRTFVELLLEQNKEADLAEIVRLEMNRIDSILTQMRKFSGPARPTFSPIHLHSVLDKSLQVLHHLLDEKKIQVTRSFAAAPDQLSGDQDQLEQAFINLLFNARDAMGQRGQLSVATEFVSAGSKAPGLPETGDQAFLKVTIRDNGAGIPGKDMERLFEPFFTTKPDGTGLGLAITRRIVQEHHGFITAESETGKGTAFTLFLPAETA